MRLHLGCGNDYKKGYMNCDWSEDVKVDKKVDITQRLPFEDNSVDEILISHTLEHTHEPIKVLEEFYRVCKKGAIIKIYVPFFSSECAFSMIDHYSFYSFTTFDCLDKNHVCHWQGVGDFETIYKKITFRRFMKPFEWLVNLNWKTARIYQELFPWLIPARHLEVFLRVRK